MSELSSREVIVSAARRLFAERGFRSVTIRDVAAEAGLSPAMVMKSVGSKEQLFTEAASFQPEPFPVDVPREDLGRELVRRVVARRDAGAAEPLARAIVLALPAPDPAAVKRRFVAAYVEPLTAQLGGDEAARTRAELVVCALLGLANGTRLYGFVPGERVPPEELVERYGALVQSLIETPPGRR